MDIFSGLTALKTSIDMAVLMKNAIGTFQEAEQKLKLAELISTLSDAKLGMVDLIEENRELKKALKFDGEMKFENNVYYQYVDGVKGSDPYCPTCWAVEKLAIHLQPGYDHGYSCGKCKGSFDTSRKTGQERPPIPRRNVGFVL